MPPALRAAPRRRRLPPARCPEDGNRSALMAGDGGAQLRIDALAPAGVSRGNRQRTSGMASRALLKSSSRGPGYASGAWSTARSGRFGRARVRGISLEHGADEANQACRSSACNLAGLISSAGAGIAAQGYAGPDEVVPGDHIGKVAAGKIAARSRPGPRALIQLVRRL